MGGIRLPETIWAINLGRAHQALCGMQEILNAVNKMVTNEHLLTIRDQADAMARKMHYFTSMDASFKLDVIISSLAADSLATKKLQEYVARRGGGRYLVPGQGAIDRVKISELHRCTQHSKRMDVDLVAEIVGQI